MYSFVLSELSQEATRTTVTSTHKPLV